MKTLIVYGTKHGCTEKCSKLLKDKLTGEVVTINIEVDTVPDITSFDNIIIGGSIYAGKIQNKINEFCDKNLNALKEKKIGLFICGMQKDNVTDQINNSFPEDLLTHAVAKESFGGELILKMMNPLEKLIIRLVSKTKKDISDISLENITIFAKLMNNL